MDAVQDSVGKATEMSNCSMLSFYCTFEFVCLGWTLICWGCAHRSPMQLLAPVLISCLKLCLHQMGVYAVAMIERKEKSKLSRKFFILLSIKKGLGAS
jgi:hypothetical protein